MEQCRDENLGSILGLLGGREVILTSAHTEKKEDILVGTKGSHNFSLMLRHVYKHRRV